MTVWIGWLRWCDTGFCHFNDVSFITAADVKYIFFPMNNSEDFSDPWGCLTLIHFLF